MAQNDDKFILLLDKMSEIGERTVRMEVEQRNMKEDIQFIKEEDAVQNKLLAEHIQGVQTAHARLDNEIKVRESLEFSQENLKSRVEKLEEAPKFRANLKSYFISIGAIAGAMVAILKVLKYLGY